MTAKKVLQDGTGECPGYRSRVTDQRQGAHACQKHQNRFVVRENEARIGGHAADYYLHINELENEPGHEAGGRVQIFLFILPCCGDFLGQQNNIKLADILHDFNELLGQRREREDQEAVKEHHAEKA